MLESQSGTSRFDDAMQTSMSSWRQWLTLYQAGANAVFKSEFFAKQPKAWEQISVSTASGEFRTTAWTDRCGQMGKGGNEDMYRLIRYPRIQHTTMDHWTDHQPWVLRSASCCTGNTLIDQSTRT